MRPSWTHFPSGFNHPVRQALQNVQTSALASPALNVHPRAFHTWPVTHHPTTLQSTAESPSTQPWLNPVQRFCLASIAQVQSKLGRSVETSPTQTGLTATILLSRTPGHSCLGASGLTDMDGGREQKAPCHEYTPQTFPREEHKSLQHKTSQ